jgi:DNA-binding NarL/FixJ family response regulator
MPITVSIVEDVQGTRDNLVTLLGMTSTVRCLGTYATGEAALLGIPRDKPDVALIDINLPGISGIECVASLKSRLPGLQVLMLTTYEETEFIFNSLRAGATGYLLKNTPPQEIVHAIEQVHEGAAPMSMQIARQVVEYFHLAPKGNVETHKLSPREHEIVTLVAKGHLDKEIAALLEISIGTVRTHLKHIYEKLHVRSRTEAAMRFSSGQIIPS